MRSGESPQKFGSVIFPGFAKRTYDEHSRRLTPFTPTEEVKLTLVQHQLVTSVSGVSVISVTSGLPGTVLHSNNEIDSFGVFEITPTDI